MGYQGVKFEKVVIIALINLWSLCTCPDILIWDCCLGCLQLASISPRLGPNCAPAILERGSIDLPVYHFEQNEILPESVMWCVSGLMFLPSYFYFISELDQVRLCAFKNMFKFWKEEHNEEPKFEFWIAKSWMVFQIYSNICLERHLCCHTDLWLLM